MTAPSDDTAAPDETLAGDLVEQARSLGLSAEDLDEVVHEVFSRQAAAINNGGLHAQLRYLIAQWGVAPDGEARSIRKLLGDLAEAIS